LRVDQALALGVLAGQPAAGHLGQTQRQGPLVSVARDPGGSLVLLGERGRR
jgi:hypothetical protein